MTAETSNARGWVLVPRVPTEAMLDSAENAMIESEWAYNAGDPDARSDAHGFPTMRIWQAVVGYRAMLAAAPPPAAARVDVRGLVALAEQMERDAAGCRRDGYTDAAVVKEDCAQRIRQTLGISAIAEALAAEGVQDEPNAEAQLTYKGVPIGPMQTFADIERQATVLADPRAAAEQAIAEALRRERMAPDDYAPAPDAPVPMEEDDGEA